MGGDVVTGFVGVGPCGAQWGQAGRWVVADPKFQEDILHHPKVISHCDDAHLVAVPVVLPDHLRALVGLLGQVLQVRLGLGRHLFAGVDVGAAVFPHALRLSWARVQSRLSR